MRTQSPLMARWNDRLGHGSVIHLSFFADALRPVVRCCTELRLALSNHPRRWAAWVAVGAGDGRGIYISDGSDLARRADAAHCTRAGNRRMAPGSWRRRGDAQ